MRLGTKAAIGTSGVVFAASLLILWVTATLLAQGLGETVETRLVSRVERELTVSSRLLDRARRDARTIAFGPVVGAYFAAGGTAEAKGALRRSLALVIRVREEYRQIRYLDAAGKEVARVQRNRDGILVTPEPGLQDKSHREYFEGLRTLPPGSALAWQVSLNREHGEIEVPFRPTIRLLAPVHDPNGKFMGGIVLNMDAEQLFPPGGSGDTEFRVVLPDGSYAQHPDTDWEFGGELGTGAGFEAEFGIDPGAAGFSSPRALHLDGPEGGLTAAEGWLVSGSDPNSASWRIIASQSDTVAFADVRSTIFKAATAVLLIAALGSLLGLVAARRITARARALSAAALRVESGDYSTPIVIEGNDELSDTARAFNSMTEELRRLIRNEEDARNELSRLNIELVRSNGELENFARVTSHDLKSPLRALAVLPDWIEEDMPEFPDEVREHLDHMRQQAQRMTDLVDGLLRYSIAGTEASHPAPVDMRHLMKVIIGTLGFGEDFRVELDLPEVAVVAVRTEIDVVIRNLVQNAIRHHDREQGEIRVAVRETCGALVISVSDDGPGIPEEYRVKVLEPLVTLVSRDESGGSGLGLAIVAKIARRWNGNVEILPREDCRGTLVRVTLNTEVPAMAA